MRHPSTSLEPAPFTREQSRVLIRRGLLNATPDGDPSRSQEVPYFFPGRFPLRIRAPEAEGAAVHHEPQITLERRFEARARACGARLLRGCAAHEIVETDDSVVVELEDARGKLTISAAFLVGADGARSLVCESRGFSGETRAATVAGLIAGCGPHRSTDCRSLEVTRARLDAYQAISVRRMSRHDFRLHRSRTEAHLSARHLAARLRHGTRHHRIC